MVRYFIQLSYNGANYHGWQVQDNANTVQAEINKALSTILEAEIKCTGCGRTDTGVHASQFFAHFDSEIAVTSGRDTLHKLNGCLPDDIAVEKLFNVEKEANSRFDAISRTYKYRISRRKDVFERWATFDFYRDLDLSLMNKCAALLMNYRDFSCFSKAHTQTKTNNCSISKAEWIEADGHMQLEISADRFLRGMVRAIVGTMLEVGEGKISKEDFVSILEEKDRTKAGASAPPNGLFLTRVVYPEDYMKEIR